MNTPPIIGHRGACGHGPENTLASIRKAHELGAEWVEFDAMLSGDDQVILFHDDALERTTGAAGNVADTKWEDLSLLDAGSWFSEDFSGEGIPLLSAAISLLEKLQMGAVIEIKPSDGRDIETARKSVEMVRDMWPKSLPTPILSSFSEPALEIAQQHTPEIPRALNMWRTLKGWQDSLQKFDCIALHCKHELLNKAKAAAIIDAGYDLRCFTVNQPKRGEELFEWGVQSIFTDFPDRFLKR